MWTSCSVGAKARLLWLAWSLLLGGLTALLVVSVVFGRQPIRRVLPEPAVLSVFLVTLLAVTGWWLLYARRIGRLGALGRPAFALWPAVPLLLVAALPLAAIYPSDLANHYFYYWAVYLNQPRTLSLLFVLLLLVGLLQRGCLELGANHSRRVALDEAIAFGRRRLVPLCLLALGALQGTTYLGELNGDFLRHWAIADALAAGLAYPAMPAGPRYLEGGMATYLVDLPLYPLQIAMSFALLGHNAAATYLPLVVPNVLIPFLVFLLFREVLGSRLHALALSSLVVLFPPLRLYSLNFFEPDANFVAILLVFCWLFVRIVRGDRRMRMWLLFGVAAGAVAIGRPEGVAYAGIYLLAGLALGIPPRPKMAALALRVSLGRKLAALACFAVPVGLFSLSTLVLYGTPWPRNWVGSVGIHNVAANWEVLSWRSAELFAVSIKMTVPALLVLCAAFLLLALVGSLPHLHRPRLLAVLMLPAWVNLATVVTMDPLVSGALYWFDFFRHASFPLPLLVLAVGVLLQALLAQIHGATASDSALRTQNPAIPSEALSPQSSVLSPSVVRLVPDILLFLAVTAGVAWEVDLLSRPTYAYGPGSANLVEEQRVNLVDVLGRPLELPRLQFQSVDGHNVPVGPPAFLATYPDQIVQHYDPVDAVKHASVTAYQTGSLFVYLAAMLLEVLAILTGVSVRSGRPDPGAQAGRAC